MKTIINELDFLKKAVIIIAKKIIQKVPHPSNAKDNYESFLKKKNRNLVKQSKTITQQPKHFDNVNIKSVITEHPNTSYKLSKTIRQAEKVSSSSSLYSDTQKSLNSLNKRNIKTAKQVHSFKDYASTYNAETLNSLNSELQLKDTESAFKSKVIQLMTQLRGFKLVTTLVLVFKKKVKTKQSMTIFMQVQKQKKLSINVTLKICLNQSIRQLWQIYKNL